jgi:Cu-processing system permease protein
MSGTLIVAGHTLQEALRRRVLLVVVVLTAVFGGLYAWGCSELFQDVSGFARPETGLDARALAGSTILGLAMFGALFLGAVLAVFLTVGAVRGDAERGLLQPIVVRPLGRGHYVLGRFLAALGLLGSVFLTVTANGICILMAYGAGLLAGLLGQIGDAIPSKTLQDIADVASWILPFEALYRDALRLLVAEVPGITGTIVQLGPLGGSHDAGSLLVPWAIAYVVLVLGAAALAFARRDL